jgi:hypothetical protein
LIDILHNLKEYSEIKAVLPSQPDALLAYPDHASVTETAQHNDAHICSETTSSYTSVPHLPTEIAEQPLQASSIEDKSQTSICDALEDGRPDCQGRADMPYRLPSDDRTTSLLFHENAGEMPKKSQRVATPWSPPSSNIPPVEVTTAPIEPPLPSDTSTDTHTPRTAEVDATSTCTHDSESLLVCILASALPPSTTHSTAPMTPVSPSKHLSELTPSSLLPDSPMCEPSSANQNALAAGSRKRKRRGQNSIEFGSQRDLPLHSIAAKTSNAILLGGRRYKPSIFETWERDLWLLNPDRAKLTLDGLLTQQRTYTEALLSQGIVARIIHSWCLTAYEHSLSTVDRSKSIRRNQKEVRLSLRCRKLGILFLEIINELFAQRNIGTMPTKSVQLLLVSATAASQMPLTDANQPRSASKNHSLFRTDTAICL